MRNHVHTRALAVPRTAALLTALTWTWVRADHRTAALSITWWPHEDLSSSPQRACSGQA